MFVVFENKAINLSKVRTIEIEFRSNWCIRFDETDLILPSEDLATSVMADILMEYDSGQSRVLNLDYIKKTGVGG